MNLQEAIAAARADYAKAVGTIIEVPYLMGYLDDGSHEWYGPVWVRILQTDDASVTHINDDFVDPYWDVELVEPALKPECRRDSHIPADARSFWIDGPSHRYEENRT